MSDLVIASEAKLIHGSAAAAFAGEAPIFERWIASLRSQ
jgi:hypothetical protein